MSKLHQQDSKVSEPQLMMMQVYQWEPKGKEWKKCNQVLEAPENVGAPIMQVSAADPDLEAQMCDVALRRSQQKSTWKLRTLTTTWRSLVWIGCTMMNAF